VLATHVRVPLRHLSLAAESGTISNEINPSKTNNTGQCFQGFGPAGRNFLPSRVSGGSSASALPDTFAFVFLVAAYFLARRSVLLSSIPHGDGPFSGCQSSTKEYRSFLPPVDDITASKRRKKGLEEAEGSDRLGQVIDALDEENAPILVNETTVMCNDGDAAIDSEGGN
jgi:hypothetical protein